MEGHATFVEHQNVRRIAQVVIQVIEQHIGRTRPDNDAKGNENDEHEHIVDAHRQLPTPGNTIHNQGSKKETGKICQTIPANVYGTD